MKENFHDSEIKEVNLKDSELSIMLNIDTHWNPGKPFGVFKFSNPKNYEDFLEFWKECVFIDDNGNYVFPKDKNAYSGIIYSVEILNNSITITLIEKMKTFSFTFDSYIFEREDSYKHFKDMINK